jgi:AbiU2
MTSEEYENLLHLIRNEIETAAAAFYTAQAINDFALEDSANYDKLNRDVRFWNLQVHALQTAYLMGLGRLFDKRGDAHSIMELLDATEEYRGFFSKAALRTRKLRTVRNQDNQQVIEASLEGIWEPTRDELRQIRKEVEPSIGVYHARYKTIRHEIFAHIGKDQKKIANALSNTLLSHVDMMFLDLLEVMDALYALFDNGVRHERRIGPHRFAHDIHERTRRVLDRL